MRKLILGLYRLCNKMHHSKHGRQLRILTAILSRCNNLFLKIIYGAYIPYTAHIGKNPKFIHSFYGIFISGGAVIGDNCTILHHVTIGSLVLDSVTTSKKSVAPKIGDNTFIGANACVIGNCVIGKNCIIGAGCTIANKMIEDNSTVVNAPARIFKHEKLDVL